MDIKLTNDHTKKVSLVLALGNDLVEVCKKSSNYQHFLRLGKKLLNSDKYNFVDWEHPKLNIKALDNLVKHIKQEAYKLSNNSLERRAEKSICWTIKTSGKKDNRRKTK